MQKVLLKTATVLFFATLIGGCSSFKPKFPWAYKVNVRQGNIIDKEAFAKLEKGMTRSQVKFVLGTPLIEDTFNPDRWDYYYTVRRDEKDLYTYHVTMHFDGDELTHWDGDVDLFKSEKEGVADIGEEESES